MILGMSQGTKHLEEWWLKMAVFQWPMRVAGMSKNYSEEVRYGHRLIWIPSHSEPMVLDVKKLPKLVILRRDSLLLVPSQRAQKAANKTVQLDEL